MRKPVSSRRQPKVKKNIENVNIPLNTLGFQENLLIDQKNELLDKSAHSTREVNKFESIETFKILTDSQEVLDNFNYLANKSDVQQEQLSQLQLNFRELHDLILDLKKQNLHLIESNEILQYAISGIEVNTQKSFHSLKKLMNDHFKLSSVKNEQFFQGLKNILNDMLQSNFDKYETKVKDLILDSVKELKNNFGNISENHEVFTDNLHNINSNILTHIPYMFKSEFSEVKNILLGVKKEKDIERTISFQLGKELLNGVRNVKEIIALPQRLRELREENLKRKRVSAAPLVNQINNLTDGKVGTVKKVANLSTTVQEKISLEKANKGDSNYELSKKPLKNKKIKILSILEKGTFESLYKYSDLNYLLEGNEKQIAGTCSDLFMIESVHSTYKNVWDYSIISNNPKHPLTQKLLNSIEKISSKNIPIVFLDRSILSNFEDFELIRNYSDVVLSCSDQVIKKNSYLKNVLKINNFYNENHFNPSEFNVKKKGGVVFFGEFNSSSSSIGEVFRPYLVALSKINSTIYKGVNVDNPIYDGIAQLKEIDTLNNALLADTLKVHDSVFYVADETEDFISEQLLSYLASSIPVVATKNIYLESQLKDIVTFVNHPNELNQAVNLLKDHRWISQRKAHLGYRLVSEKYTSKRFINQISDLFIESKNQEQQPMISILMATMREEYLDRIILNLTRQNYVNKEIIIMTQNWSIAGVEKLEISLKKSNQFRKVIILSENSDKTLGERLNICASCSDGESNYLSKMDDDDFYFENYLSDMVLPFSYGDYALVGKAENFIYLEGLNKLVLTRDGRASNREMDFVAGPTLVFKKSIFKVIGGFKHVNNGEDSDLIKRIRDLKLKVYSSDIFNFVQFRSKNSLNHTWQVKAEVFEKSCTFVSKGIDESIVRV